MGTKKPKLQKRRLLKLAAYLESLPELYKKPLSRRKSLPGFDMNVFYSSRKLTAHERFGAFGGYGAPECGTRACAAGHAARIPEFRKAGLRLKPRPGQQGNLYLFPHYQGKIDFEALAKFFGITKNEASELFVPSTVKSDFDYDPVYVAQYIRNFVALKDAQR